ncbi:L-arabinose isomerase [Rhodopirellula rubra]|uniref:L-arabinose isomerase n=1 Tax=Aporhodopirellula rubra TaxID=980271 RepID=A0A7W5DY07_9BACT|nr:L-arabinose isomerase [Aporhodopirellula rubra]MBB3205682.1 L-arabinose isomerase [Aporhodopirellula rubra]
MNFKLVNAMQNSTQEIWFVTGSQHLYGEETLRTVADNSRQVVAGLNEANRLPVEVVFKSVVTTADSIVQVFRDANNAPECIGVVCWMHTFSPAKMWIAGLSVLDKPMAHLHTQFNRDLPWSTIDMDFMNLNQAAHGDREFGFICTRMRKPRKVVVGHWQDEDVHARLASWTRAAIGAAEMRSLKVVRFGDNMRQVAVTEGDKVEAQMKFGLEVNTYGVGDLVQHIENVSDAAATQLAAEYDSLYRVADSMQPNGPQRDSLVYAARVEIGLRSILDEIGARAFTDTFEDLHGLDQLPGMPVQRLMADGYGFAGEGDWKTAALVRVAKAMARGMEGGTSFMEDYTYHFHPDGHRVLGAHMLEICPSIANGKPTCEIHPLGIGGKSDPVRLVFTAPPGPAINVAMLDMGDRFRMLVNEVDAVAPEHPLPNLPVASALWAPRPDLKTAAAAWIYAGGPHHTVFSQSLTSETIEDFAEMMDVECLFIDGDTHLRSFKQQL